MQSIHEILKEIFCDLSCDLSYLSRDLSQVWVNQLYENAPILLFTEKIIDVRSFLLVFSVEQLNVEHNYIYIISPEFGHIDINVNVKEEQKKEGREG